MDPVLMHTPASPLRPGGFTDQGDHRHDRALIGGIEKGTSCSQEPSQGKRSAGRVRSAASTRWRFGFVRIVLFVTRDGSRGIGLGDVVSVYEDVHAS